MTAALAWLRGHPVIVLDAVKFLLAGGTAIGWWQAPDSPVSDIGSAFAALAFLTLTGVTHYVTAPPEPQEKP